MTQTRLQPKTCTTKKATINNEIRVNIVAPTISEQFKDLFSFDFEFLVTHHQMNDENVRQTVKVDEMINAIAQLVDHQMPEVNITQVESPHNNAMTPIDITTVDTITEITHINIRTVSATINMIQAIRMRNEMNQL